MDDLHEELAVQLILHSALSGHVITVPWHSSDVSQFIVYGVVSFIGGGYGTFKQLSSHVNVLMLFGFQIMFR